MAFAPFQFNAKGSFIEKEFGHTFEFKELPTDEEYEWGESKVQHILFMSTAKTTCGNTDMQK